MLTYEDFLAASEEGEDKKVDFILRAINEHKKSEAYKTAQAAQAYYDGENPTIMQYEKILYDMQGRAHVDMWSANHKIASSFFTFVIDQEVSYLLGNGVRFSKDQTKDQLGEDFDLNVMDALEYARIGGVAYGFWNLNRVDVFKSTEFIALLGEETNTITAGIRFWQLDDNKPLRVTLYEMDGYTEYVQRVGKKMIVLKPKQAYKKILSGTPAEGTEITDGGNYDGFPIVPLYANKAHKSALRGKRNTIDALDLATSSMVNNVDEGALIYWVLTNCGGMNDLDDAKFIERLKTTRVSHADGDSGAKAEAHSIEAPFEGTKVTVEMLREQLYDDFQAFDAKSMAAGDLSATAIHAGYTRIDLKTDKIEREVTRFILGILKLAGIDDRPTYERNKIANATEDTQRVLMQAEYLDEEYITKKLLAINGDIDQYDEIMKRRDAEDAQRLKMKEQSISAENFNVGAEQEAGSSGDQSERV